MGSASARDDGQQGIKYHFVEHLTSVPSVNFLCFATAECYNALKKRSALAAIALGAVEKCASHAYACVGKPAVEQLSGPLKVADDLACKVLQKLENNYPVTIKMPHEIIGDARDFGTRKYTNGRDYVREKVDVCRDLSERVLKAACQPAETATSFVRCTRATVWQELAVAESACDACIKNINEDCTSEAHPRNYTLPRIFRLLWKASICVSQYAITEHRRVNDLIGKVFATAESVLEEPAEPLHRPTRYILHTTIEHGGAAFRHVVKLSTQLWRVYVDAFVLLYRTVWTSLSALLCGTVCSTIDYLQDLSGQVLDAACRPVDTATSVVRCTRANFWHHVTVAESACDAYIKTMDEDGAQETDTRNSALPRLLHTSWEASVSVSRYAAAVHQRAKDFAEGTFAAAARFLAEPAEPLRQPTTASEHASAALRHVVKVSAQLGQVSVDEFALVYRTAWSWLSARFTGLVIASERTSSKVSTLECRNPAHDCNAYDSQEGSSSSDSSCDWDDST